MKEESVGVVARRWRIGLLAVAMTCVSASLLVGAATSSASATTTQTTPSLSPDIGAPIPSAMVASPRWRETGSRCRTTGVEGWSKYTWCWSKKKRINTNTKRDIWAFRLTNSGHAVDRRLMNRLWVEMDPRDHSPKMRWRGADPFKPDQTVSGASDGCTDWSWTVGAGPIAYSESGKVCAGRVYYTPKLYAKPGRHAGIRLKTNCWKAGNVQKVSAAVLVSTRKGKEPLWQSKVGIDARRHVDNCKSYGF